MKNSNYTIRMEMLMRLFPLSLALCLALSFSPWSAGEAKAAPYMISPLSIGIYSGAFANGINADGVIVGYSDASNPIYWSSPTADPTALSSGAFVNPLPGGISDGGAIVGFDIGATPAVPVYWSSLTAAPTAFSAGTFGSAFACGINDGGAIVGFAGVSYQYPLYWSSPTADPTTLSVGTFGVARAQGINDNGEIVGFSDQTPLYWSSPTADPTALSVGTFGVAYAQGINDSGVIVGMNGTGEAIFWSTPTVDPTLLPLGTFTFSFAGGINDGGAIVGVSVDNSTPLLWTPANLLTLEKAGTGTGRVSSEPAGIDCGTDCPSQTASFTQLGKVTLTAQADPGSVFMGWNGGGCSGTEACELTMGSDPVTVTAQFDRVTAVPTLSQWGLMIFTVLIAASACWSIRRQRCC